MPTDTTATTLYDAIRARLDNPTRRVITPAAFAEMLHPHAEDTDLKAGVDLVEFTFGRSDTNGYVGLWALVSRMSRPWRLPRFGAIDVRARVPVDLRNVAIDDVDYPPTEAPAEPEPDSGWCGMLYTGHPVKGAGMVFPVPLASNSDAGATYQVGRILREPHRRPTTLITLAGGRKLDREPLRGEGWREW